MFKWLVEKLIDFIYRKAFETIKDSITDKEIQECLNLDSSEIKNSRQLAIVFHSNNLYLREQVAKFQELKFSSSYDRTLKAYDLLDAIKLRHTVMFNCYTNFRENEHIDKRSFQDNCIVYCVCEDMIRQSDVFFDVYETMQLITSIITT